MTRSTLWQDGVPSKSLTVRTDINIPELRNGKGVPDFCVQLFRLADFFQLDELKSKATKELEVYFDNTIAFSNAEKGETSKSPQWLTDTLGAVEDAYKDNNTAPILKTLLELIYKNSHRILRFKDAVDSFDKIPELAKDLVKNHIVDDLTKRPSLRSFKFRLGLPVLAAMRYAGISYGAGDEKASPFGSAKMPCLLYPNLGVSSFILTSADGAEESENECQDGEFKKHRPQGVHYQPYSGELDVAVLIGCLVTASGASQSDGIKGCLPSDSYL